MESSGLGLDQNLSGASDDFPALLRRRGLLATAPSPAAPPRIEHKDWIPTQATTILAFKFQGGVLVAGDRRATAGNTVVYDRADKVLEIDRHSIMA
ncbi:MAG: proteasome subunit alpha, partial [Verrucomicrobia bacterium]